MIRMLDQYCADGVVSGSDTVFLKMDIKGYDLGVFKVA